MGLVVSVGVLSASGGGFSAGSAWCDSGGGAETMILGLLLKMDVGSSTLEKLAFLARFVGISVKTQQRNRNRWFVGYL